MKYDLSFDNKSVTLLAICIIATALLLVTAGFLLGVQSRSAAAPPPNAPSAKTPAVSPVDHPQAPMQQPTVDAASTSTVPAVKPTTTVDTSSSVRSVAPGVSTISPEHAVSEVMATKGYTLQFGAFREESNAEVLIKRLKDKNVQAGIARFNDVTGMTWYTVRFGNYSTLSEASAAAVPLRISAQQSILIRPSDRI
jgi:cell division protein FtsN